MLVVSTVIRVAIFEEAKSVREMSIAVMSTSALLLTILAVVHVPSNVSSFPTFVTVSGLYIATGLALPVLIFSTPISSKRRSPADLRWDRRLYRLMWGASIAQILLFFVGLVGVCGTILSVTP